MNTTTILQLLKNSGFHGLRADAEFIYMEDPSCILRSFETFVDYVWVIITALTGIMLFGWGLSKVRGVKNDIFSNMINLTMVFGVLAVAKPVMNVIYGDNLFGMGCDTISVSIEDTEKMLEMRKDLLKNATGDLYESIEIYDSAADVSYVVLPEQEPLPEDVKDITELLDVLVPEQEPETIQTTESKSVATHVSETAPEPAPVKDLSFRSEVNPHIEPQDNTRVVMPLPPLQLMPLQ